MRKHILILLLAAAAVSCKTNQLYINVLQPAPVTMSPGIKKVGIINRSIPTDETKTLDALDRVLSLESTDLDKDGAWECITGVASELKNNDRFSEVVLLDDIDFRSSRIGILPPMLSNRIADSICRVKGIDALFALERFDTDTRISTSSAGSVETAVGNLPFLGFQVTMETIIKSGWRIYYPAEGRILDEFSFAESLGFTAKGISILAAAGALKDRKNAIREVSRNAGMAYAERILPYRLNVNRDYFVKGTNNFKIARRKAQMGKWDEAGTLWDTETANPKAKIAGRAWYNMAILSEINGDIDKAMELAARAWEDYKTRKALDYTRILERRKDDKRLLEIQEIKE
ncbi:MAG: hypothetical protein JXR67_03490 [Bacteroidales bacterium]|nr:hypothetical protein [Bacteroidales bacterium]